MDTEEKTRLETPQSHMSSWQWTASDVDSLVKSPKEGSPEQSRTEAQQSTEIQPVAASIEAEPKSAPTSGPNTASAPLRNLKITSTEGGDLRARAKDGLENIRRLLKIHRERKAEKEKKEALVKISFEEASKAEGHASKSESLFTVKPSPPERRKAARENLLFESDNVEETGIGRGSTFVVQKLQKEGAIYLTQTQLTSPAPRSPRRGIAVPKTPQITQSNKCQSHAKHNRRLSSYLFNMDTDKNRFNTQHDSIIFPQQCKLEDLYIRTKILSPTLPTSSQINSTHNTPARISSARTSPTSVIDAEHRRGITSNGKVSAADTTASNDDLPLRRTRRRDDSPSGVKNEIRSKKSKLDHHIAGSPAAASNNSSSQPRNSPSMNPQSAIPAQEIEVSIESPTLPPKNLLELIPFILHFDKQHKEALASGEEQIVNLKAEITSMQTADHESEPHLSTMEATAAQETNKLQEKITQLLKEKSVAQSEVEALKKDLLTSKDASSTTEAIIEISGLRTQATNLTSQLAKQTQLVNRYMAEWKRVKAVCEDQKASLEEAKKNTIKLTQNLKAVSDDLKREKLDGKRVEFEKLKKIIEEVLAMPEIAPMASRGFGRVGQAFIRLQDVVKEVSDGPKVENDEDEGV